MSENLKHYIKLLEEVKLLGTIMMHQKSEDEEALSELETMNFHLEMAIDILRMN
jgi:hypothetical protein